MDSLRCIDIINVLGVVYGNGKLRCICIGIVNVLRVVSGNGRTVVLALLTS